MRNFQDIIVNWNIWKDFQICISVPLTPLHGRFLHYGFTKASFDDKK